MTEIRMSDPKAATERLARLLYDAFEGSEGESYLSEFRLDGPVTIDGRFNFMPIAAFLAKALAQEFDRHLGE